MGVYEGNVDLHPPKQRIFRCVKRYLRRIPPVQFRDEYDISGRDITTSPKGFVGYLLPEGRQHG